MDPVDDINHQLARLAATRAPPSHHMEIRPAYAYAPQHTNAYHAPQHISDEVDELNARLDMLEKTRVGGCAPSRVLPCFLAENRNESLFDRPPQPQCHQRTATIARTKTYTRFAARE